jgi:hypothetical protein
LFSFFGFFFCFVFSTLSEMSPPSGSILLEYVAKTADLFPNHFLLNEV